MPLKTEIPVLQGGEDVKDNATLNTPRTSLRIVGDAVRITLRGRDGVEIDVPLGKLDRWAITQLRDGVFPRYVPSGEGGAD